MSIRSWLISSRVRRCIRLIEAKRDLVSAMTSIIKLMDLSLLNLILPGGYGDCVADGGGCGCPYGCGDGGYTCPYGCGGYAFS
jgi:hypothetical protein